MPIKEKDWVKISYTEKIKDTGKVIGTTDPETAQKNNIDDLYDYDIRPIYLQVGADDFYPSIDKYFIGHEAGDKLTIEVPYKDAYGPRNPELVFTIPLSEIKNPDELYEDMVFKFDRHVGHISKITDNEVEIDFNVFNAGEDIIFEVEILEYKKDEDEGDRDLIHIINDDTNERITYDREEVSKTGTGNIYHDAMIELIPELEEEYSRDDLNRVYSTISQDIAENFMIQAMNESLHHMEKENIRIESEDDFMNKLDADLKKPLKEIIKQYIHEHI